MQDKTIAEAVVGGWWCANVQMLPIEIQICKISPFAPLPRLNLPD